MKLYRELLKEWILFKSISTDPKYSGEIQKTARWLAKIFKEHGFKSHIVKGYDNPLVLAYYEVSPDEETCLIYGHYDVQPAAKEDGWYGDPFAVVEKNGRLHARGIIDNKGQVLVHIATIFELIKEKKLRYNVKFLIEGNEETGSPLLEKFIKDNPKTLDCDFIIVSDGEVMMANPTIELGFRGGFNAQIKIRTSNTDLHSGIYGGLAPNPVHEMSQLIAKIYDENQEIQIPHFYDDVDQVSPATRRQNKSLPFDLKEYKKVSGTKTLINEPGVDIFTQVGLRPSIQISGIKAGYTDEGYKNIIPSTATAKINVRLVKSQNPLQIFKLFKDFVLKNIPKYCQVKIELDNPYEGIKLSVDNIYTKRAAAILAKAYDKKPIYKYSGGGIPIITYFDAILHKPQVLVPLANEDCAMHAANENFKLDHLKKALDFSRLFFER